MADPVLSPRVVRALVARLAGHDRLTRAIALEYRASLAARMLEVRSEAAARVEFAKRNLLPYLRDMDVMATHAWLRLATAQIGSEWALVEHALTLLPKPHPSTPAGRAKVAARALARYRADPGVNLRIRVGTLLRYHLRRVGSSKDGPLREVLGYSIAQLYAALNATMPAGYTWADFLSGALHIDHRTPISVFNITSDKSPDFRRAWALTNLRLLPAGANMAKGARLDRPFQPTLDL